MSQISENIKQARLSTGKSQQEVADYLDIKRSTYANWEAGTEPTVGDMKRIADFLDTSVSKLIGEDILLQESNKVQAAAILHTKAWVEEIAGVVAEIYAQQKGVLVRSVLEEMATHVEAKLSKGEQG